MSKKIGPCALCGREVPLTFHHYIPRTVHSNKWFKKNFTREQMAEGIDVCRDCHSAVHKFVPSEKELARKYNAREKLLEHEEIATFVAWISQRDPSSRVRTRAAKPNRRGRR